jgi:hypothetical protein
MDNIIVHTDQLSTEQIEMFENSEQMLTTIENELAEDSAPLPIDDESNRLGQVVMIHDDYRVYQHNDVFFVWFKGDGRGFPAPTMDDAYNACGIYKPTGYADYEGTIRVGKLLEKGPNGVEIWREVLGKPGKNPLDYYVWNSTGLVSQAASLGLARQYAGINTSPKKEQKLTLPKSAYPQCQPGYKAGSITVSKKAKGK